MALSTRTAYWLVLSLLACLAASCVERYEPEVLKSGSHYLVVDGFINGSGPTSIRLSRSINLDNGTGTYPPETKATVFIENLGGTRYALAESPGGVYTAAIRQLPPGQQYRLRIRTSGGDEYASEYTLLKQTPAIDQFEGRVQADGLQLYISAHDNSSQTRYYRWQYEETWEFTSAYWSHWKFAKGTSQRRPYFPRTEDIYHCWRTENATLITTTSTVRLNQDAVRDYRLLFIPSSSKKLISLYSILVRQYAMSQEEFDYWEAVKKNTENIGTLFDPLPNRIQGNVHSLTDASEPVFGFVGACTVVEKRIFINRLSLPAQWWPVDEQYANCTDVATYIHDTLRLGKNMYEEFADTTYRIPINEIRRLDGTIIGFTNQTPDCVDCRRFGTNIKPSFWPR
ncbi:DUF4249 domain-containing protein [Hymenobacter rigui]|uniref:DUF4249 domain-containing protein n=1 Tax=Hymenobacter rigui TaxID=334424 RepID=A0A3R9ML89_9BACT|nr:DUF4249 domain-containing protein [Hymenobacter rigui]RSK48434.1 DUF4249 domain-containing protein [Hymenobacter rigui]